MPRHRSSAVPLAWLYAGLIVYASLYPFADWRAPGASPFAFLVLGWHRWWSPFDLVSNLLGYLPLGFLVFVALSRAGWRVRAAVWGGPLAGALLSLAMELLQNYLPRRIPSNVDLALNVWGAALGAAVGAVLHLRGGIERWQKLRERWFVASSAGGLALLVLWPIALLFPTAVPFGLGHVLGRVQPALAGWLADTPLEAWTAGWSNAPEAAASLPALSPGNELAIIVLGLTAPCLVAFTVAVPGWRRAVLALGAAAVGCAATTLSTALSFGPSHAWAWTTPRALLGVVIGTGAAAMLSIVPRRVVAGLGLVAFTMLVMLVARAPADPYFAQSLSAWEQGRFIRFHGAAQWVGWLWPYAGLTFLLVRLAAREGGGTKGAS